MNQITEQQNAVSIAVIQTEVTHLKTAFARSEDKLDKIMSTMDEARGGWRTLLLIGGAAGTVGGGLSWLITHWRG